MRRASWIPSVLLVLALPFILATIQGETNRLTIIIVGLVLTPILALQTWTQNLALRDLEDAVAPSEPTPARQTIERMAKLIFSVCFAATVVDVCVLLGLKAGLFPKIAAGAPSFWLNVGLVVTSVVILTGPVHRLLHLAVAVSPAILLGFAVNGNIDVVPVAAWLTLFGLVCAIILSAIQNKAMFEISASLAEAGATLKTARTEDASERALRAFEDIEGGTASAH